MEVVIQKSRAAATALTARLIAEAIESKPQIVLGLATGRTMEEVYGHLAKMHQEDNLDFSLARTFNLDEYVGLPATHPGSYRYYMNRHLFQHVNIDPRNTFLPNGMAGDVALECYDYDDLIDELGGIDVQLLGLGRSGHIGFNEPLTSLNSRTHVQVLAPLTIQENQGQFADPAEMPRRALTMGVGTIMEARQLIMLVTGAAKAEILAQAIEGPLTARVTASAVQLHEDCIVICDEEAAARLQERDYYRWVFDNDPNWDDYR